MFGFLAAILATAARAFKSILQVRLTLLPFVPNQQPLQCPLQRRPILIAHVNTFAVHALQLTTAAVAVQCTPACQAYARLRRHSAAADLSQP